MENDKKNKKWALYFRENIVFFVFFILIITLDINSFSLLSYHFGHPGVGYPEESIRAVIIMIFLYPAFNFLLGTSLYAIRLKKICFIWEDMKNSRIYVGIILSIALHILITQSSNYYGTFLINTTAFAISGILSLLVGFNFRRIDQRFFDTTVKKRLPHLDENDLENYAKKILDSDEFLTILRTTLPSGKTDKNYGFDHIPFLLDKIGERRKRFEKSSKAFLGLTIFFGILFAIILVFWGYILVTEDSVGSGRYLRKIENSTDIYRNDLEIYMRSTVETSMFRNEYLPELESLMDQKWLENDVIPETTYTKIKGLIDQVKSTGDINQLIDSLVTIKAGFKAEKTNIEYFNKLNSVISKFEDFKDKRLKARSLVRSKLEKIDDLIPKVSEEIKKTDSRIAELLKRFSIGIIVVSFFLAILRYLSKLYKDHLQEVIEADRDDLAVRTFYVSFKCSEANPEERKIVLQEFMKSIKKKKDISTKDDSKENDVLKDFLKIVAKKI